MGTGAPRILLAGGGYVGLYTALQLEKRLEPGEADVILVNPDNYMVYQPLLPEVASGTLEPRHAVVPLRKALSRTRLVTGLVTAIDLEGKTATVEPLSGEAYDVGFDHVVVGVGSVTRVLPVPGVEARGVGFKTIEEAIHLRDHVLGCLEAAEAAADAETRRRALTFTFVGGGYTGVEALAELEDLAQSVAKHYPTISANELRWVLVEATDRILPTVDRELSEHALQVLRARGIEVHLETQLESAEDGLMRLSNGEEFHSDTLVWMAGVAPHELVTRSGFPVDDKGLLQVEQTLRVQGVPYAWGAGDNAAVPDGDGGFFPPTAQHAQREAKQIGENIAAVLRGEEPQAFAYSSPGEMITLGRNKGVATLYGRELRGFLPWLMRRFYYVAQIPTMKRKVRILLDMLVGMPFHRDVVSLRSSERPGDPIREAADQAERAA